MKYLISLLTVLALCMPVFAEDIEEYKCDLLIKGYDFTNDGLSEAIIKNDKEAIELFVKADLNINLPDTEGYSAMDRAIKSKNTDTISYIAQAGGETKKLAVTTNELIAENNEEKTLEKPTIAIPKTETTKPQTKTEEIKINKFCELVNSNDIFAVNKYAKTSKNIDEISTEGLAPIHYAIFNENRDMVITLIMNGADVNVLTEEGLTALDIAVLNNQKEIAKTLLEEGAELSESVASELKKFGCPVLLDETSNLYIAKFEDIFSTMVKIQTKMNN